MRTIKLFLAAAFLSFSFSTASFGQLPGFEIGLHGGAYVYQGDLAPRTFGSLKTIKPGVGLSIAKPITPAFSVAANLNYAWLKGDDTRYDHPDYRAHRAFKFKGRVREVSLTANYYPLHAMQPKLEPYLFAGIGANFRKATRDTTGFNPLYFSDADNITSRLAQDMAVNPSKPMLVIPIGMGLRFPISNSFMLNTAFNYRLSLTDYVDGYSLAANPGQNDHYYSLTVGLIYQRGALKGLLNCPSNVQ